MATFSINISPYAKKDGTRNVRILVFHDDEKKYIPTNFYLSKSDLTAKSGKIKNQEYTDALNEILKKCRDRCNQQAGILGNMNVNQVAELVIDIIEGREIKRGFELDFLAYGQQYIEKLIKAGRKGNAKTYKIALNNLAKFTGRTTLSIHEITSNFVERWIDWIKELPPPKNKQKGNRAASLYPANIRALHNEAKQEFNNEDLGIINIPYSPFKKKGTIPQTPLTQKLALSAEKIRNIVEIADEKSVYSNSRLNLAKDVFIISFMLIGMNTADLYNCDLIDKNRIIYNRVKTKNRRADRAEISVKIEPEMMPFLEKYKDLSGKKVFKFHQMYADAETFNMAVNIGLKNKKITETIGVDNLKFYAARHSWATIAANDCRINKYVVHEALNHASDSKMKVTDIYIKKDYSLQDEANRKVLDLVFGLAAGT